MNTAIKHMSRVAVTGIGLFAITVAITCVLYWITPIAAWLFAGICLGWIIAGFRSE